MSLEYRDGKVEKISESTRRGVGIELYVDDRYSLVSTSDLRPDALKTLITDSIAIAKTLAPDPFRALPDPALYRGQSSIDLKLEDAKYDSVTADKTQQFAKEGTAIETKLVAEGQKPAVSVLAGGHVDCGAAATFVQTLPAASVIFSFTSPAGFLVTHDITAAAGGFSP